MLRKAGIGAVLAGSAVALSGCVVFMATPTAKRKGTNVTITIKGCASQSSGSPTGSCTNTGNAHTNATPSTKKAQQVFLGFRVPSGATAPNSFTATSGPFPGGGKLKFKHSSSYSHELQRLAPAGAGKKWFGYASQLFVYSTSSGSEQNFTAHATFVLKGTLKYFVVIGGRIGFTVSSSVKCGHSLTTLNAPNGHSAVICEDDSASGSA